MAALTTFFSSLLKFLLLFACCRLGYCADELIDWQREALSGNWNGERSALSAKGVDVQFMLRATAMDEFAGGARRGTGFLQNLEAKAAFDGEKLWHLADSSVFLHLILNGGGKFNRDYAQTAMGVENSETPDNNAKLYQAWFNKNFPAQGVSILAGVYPVDSEFYVNDASGVFLHPSFGMAAEVAQTNVNGPSIYPLSSLGVRVKYLASPVIYLQAALLDADPGTSSNPHWSHFDPRHGDGSFAILEAGYYPAEAGHTIDELEPEKGVISSETRRQEEKYEGAGKYAVGAWRYSKPFPDLSALDAAGNPVKRKNEGWYLLAEQSLYRPEDLKRDFAVFLRYGRASPDVNPADYSQSFGVRYRGVIRGRQDDVLGLAYTRLHSSPKFVATGMAADETALEITYRMQLKPWVAVQPMFERVIHPGRDPTLRAEKIIGLRLDLWI